MIPAQSIIQREFAADLPAILAVETQLVLRQIDEGLRLDLHGVGGAQQEAGVRVSYRSAADRGALKVRQAGFGPTKIVDTGSGTKNLRPKTFPPQVAAEFIRMVILDPCQAGGCRRLLREQRVAVGGRTHVLHAALRVTQTCKAGEQAVDRCTA